MLIKPTVLLPYIPKSVGTKGDRNRRTVNDGFLRQPAKIKLELEVGGTAAVRQATANKSLLKPVLACIAGGGGRKVPNAAGLQQVYLRMSR